MRRWSREHPLPDVAQPPEPSDQPEPSHRPEPSYRPEPAEADVLRNVVPAYDGFDLQVLVDRGVYAPGDTVRLTITAANQGDRFVEHHYPGWQRYVLTIRDAHNRVVADDEVERHADTDAIDRFLPGQMMIWPTYWGQTAGPIVPGRERHAPGERVPPGRYRARVRWLGREPGVRQQPPEVDSGWFTLT